MARQFNEYAKKNDIDIEVNVEIYSFTNSSLNVDDYGSGKQYWRYKCRY